MTEVDWSKDATQPAAWNVSQDGLPAVGTFCEVIDDDSLKYGQGESGEVVAHVENCAVIRMSYGLGCFTAAMLRTPEQIAADEREADVDKLTVLIKSCRGLSIRLIAEAIHGAGYRKPTRE